MFKHTSHRLLGGVAAIVFGMALLPVKGHAAEAAYHEPFRPQFHFSPPRNWMNDPNGLVFHDGVYHLFYQYNPQGDKWGHMSWGHATSRDLFHWENQPLALAEKDGVMMFSGSAVVDAKNTSGLGQGGKGPLVAIYTGDAESKKKRQDQRLAYSNDEGHTWTQYSGNPVLDLGIADFRDPKVFWHEAGGKWIMTTVLATEHKVRFFSSPDLKHWTALSDFGPAGATSGQWECPDLFPLSVEGDAAAKKWVLLVSVNPGGPTGGSGSQYFIGDFDGTHFTADPVAAQTQKETTLPVDSAGPAGKMYADFEGDNYAGWTPTGKAFGDGPSHNTSGDLTGYVGKGYVDSFGSADADTGKLTSPPFKVEAPQISFLMGGGNHPGETGMNLLVDGKTVRTATGNNAARLEPQSWDVSEFIGKTATLEIIDLYDKDDWGHIFVDQIVFGAGQPTAAAPNASALWVDYGSDYYAGVTWSDIPPADGRRILLGWMSNWAYGEKVPTSPWRSAMTIPRLLSLRKTDAGLRLVQYPVAELQSLRKGSPRKFDGGAFTDAAAWLNSMKELPATLSVEMSFNNVSEQTPFVLNIHAGPNEVTSITCDPAKAQIIVDRTHSGATDFERTFAAKHTAPLRVPDGRLSLRLVLDTSSLEVFAQDGETVLTDSVFQTGTTRRLELVATAADTPAVNTITISTLSSSMDGSSTSPH